MAVVWPGGMARWREVALPVWMTRLWLVALDGIYHTIAQETGSDERGDAADSAPADEQAAISLAHQFDTLFARHERQVYRYLWRVTGDRQAASDLCQETFLRAWQHIARVSGYAEPLGWLLRVATHLALNHRRRRATRVGLPVALNLPAPGGVQDVPAPRADLLALSGDGVLLALAPSGSGGRPVLYRLAPGAAEWQAEGAAPESVVLYAPSPGTGVLWAAPGATAFDPHQRIFTAASP